MVAVQLWQPWPRHTAQLICRIRSEVEFGIYNQSRTERERERLIFLVTEERTLLGKKEETKEIWNLDHFFKCILVYRHVWERERVHVIQCRLLRKFKL